MLKYVIFSIVGKLLIAKFFRLKNILPNEVLEFLSNTILYLAYLIYLTRCALKHDGIRTYEITNLQLARNQSVLRVDINFKRRIHRQAGSALTIV